MHEPCGFVCSRNPLDCVINLILLTQSEKSRPCGNDMGEDAPFWAGSDIVSSLILHRFIGSGTICKKITFLAGLVRCLYIDGSWYPDRDMLGCGGMRGPEDKELCSVTFNCEMCQNNT